MSWSGWLGLPEWDSAWVYMEWASPESATCLALPFRWLRQPGWLGERDYMEKTQSG